jgi:hypothetical protein
MTLRYLRMTAWSILLVYIPWEIASQPPLALLLAAFVAAWCLLIDFLIHLNEDWERAEKGLGDRRLAGLPAGLVFLGSIAFGVALLVFSDDTVEKLFGVGVLIAPVGGLIYALRAALREVRRNRREVR